MRLTPRLFHRLWDEHRESVEHLELLAGIICTAIVNTSIRAPKEAAKPTDFMPSKADSNAESTTLDGNEETVNRNQIARDVRHAMGHIERWQRARDRAKAKKKK